MGLWLLLMVRGHWSMNGGSGFVDFTDGQLLVIVCRWVSFKKFFFFTEQSHVPFLFFFFFLILSYSNPNQRKLEEEERDLGKGMSE